MTKIQEKMQFAALGVAVAALTLVFGLALVLNSGPPAEGQESRDATVLPLPPFRSAFDHPDVGQEFGVIEGGIIAGDGVEIPEEKD